MAIFTICINKQRRRRDSPYQVRIRVAHVGEAENVLMQQRMGVGRFRYQGNDVYSGVGSFF